MLKKKKSKKRAFSLEDMPALKVRNKRPRLQKHDSESFFKDFNKVGSALLESLVQNDTAAFIEILDTYLQVNKAQVAKNTKMARSPINPALSRTGNPTLKTIARIVHESVA